MLQGAFDIFDACFTRHMHREGRLEGRDRHDDLRDVVKLVKCSVVLFKLYLDHHFNTRFVIE